MTIPSTLAETITLAFKQALRAREFDAAELLLQALERLNAGSWCEAALQEASLALDDPIRHPRSSRRPFY